MVVHGDEICPIFKIYNEVIWNKIKENKIRQKRVSRFLQLRRTISNTMVRFARDCTGIACSRVMNIKVVSPITVLSKRKKGSYLLGLRFRIVLFLVRL